MLDEQPHLNTAAATHPGMKGKKNEDRYGVSAFRFGGEDGPLSILAIVSDGIGGHRAGEVAAEMAVDLIDEAVKRADLSDPAQTLSTAIVEASRVIRTQAESDPAKTGMGATVACALVIGNRLFTASVGDSRIYLIRGETIRKLTIDHTWVQEAMDIGTLTPEQARSHPHAHVIRRYLGSPQEVVPDQRLRLKPEETDQQAEANQGLRLVSGDFLLLCSDGLTDLVEDAEILAAMKTKSLKSALDGLIELANERGGHDNITLVVLEMPQKEKSAVPPVEEIRAPARTWGSLPLTLSCAGLGALLLIGTLIFGGLYWAVTRPLPTTTSTATHEPFPTATSTIPVAATFDGETGDEISSTPTPPLHRTLSPSHATYTPWLLLTSTPELLLPDSQ
jgi:PPM family protein phosphatase